jgi:hypothetical protein
LTDKIYRILTSIPLPERERGFEAKVSFLASLFLSWEKELRDWGEVLLVNQR